MDCACGLGVHCGKPTMQGTRSASFGFELETTPQVDVDRGHVDQAAKERAKPKPSAPDDDGKTASFADLFDRTIRCSGIGNGVDILVRIDYVDQVVSHALALFGRRLGGPDVETTVDLDAVGAHELAVKGSGQADGGFGLACRGRPGDHQ
jgi:hypothetical protein